MVQPRKEIQDQGAGVAEPGPSSWRYLALCMAIGAIVDLGRFQRLQNADSIVPVLVSLQHWTPFYWEADRFGMLVPLLTVPFRNPFINLLVQGWIEISCGLASFFLLARYMVPRLHWPVAGSVGATCFLWSVPVEFQFQWLVEQQYATAFVLALSSLLLVDEGLDEPKWQLRLLAALGLICLANWVNFAVGLTLLPLALLRGCLLQRVERSTALRSPLFLSATLLVFGMMAGQILVRMTGVKTIGAIHEGFAPRAEWPQAWMRFAASSADVIAHRGSGLLYVLSVPILGVVYLVAVPQSRRSWRHVLASVSALVVVGLSYWLLVGISVWVNQGNYVARYAFPSLFLWSVAFAILVSAPMATVTQSRWTQIIALGCSLLPVAAALRCYGMPSLGTARAEIDQLMGKLTAEILETHSDLIAGSYWSTWPAVFHANLRLYERGEHRSIYGVAYRMRPTVPKWLNTPHALLRIAMPVGDAEAIEYMRSTLSLCPIEVEHGITIDVLRVDSCQ